MTLTVYCRIIQLLLVLRSAGSCVKWSLTGGSKNENFKPPAKEVVADAHARFQL